MVVRIWDGRVKITWLDWPPGPPGGVYQVEIGASWVQLTLDEARGLLHALWADLDEQKRR